MKMPNRGGEIRKGALLDGAKISFEERSMVGHLRVREGETWKRRRGQVKN